MVKQAERDGDQNIAVGVGVHDIEQLREPSSGELQAVERRVLHEFPGDRVAHGGDGEAESVVVVLDVVMAGLTRPSVLDVENELLEEAFPGLTV